MKTIKLETDKLPPEQEAIRRRCFRPTSAFVEFKKEDSERSVPARFEEQVRKYPGKVAVTEGNLKVTYDALNRAANRVAHRVLSERGEGSEPVVLLIEQGITAITAIMGALKAGKFYVPLDPTLQASVLSNMLLDSDAKLILTDARTYPLASNLGLQDIPTINIEESLPGESHEENLELPISPEDLASNYYTSGSTGQPKGVLHTHRSTILDIMSFVEDIRITSDDNFTLLHGPSSSASFRNTFSALLNGASLNSLNIREQGLSTMADWLRQRDITVYNSTPTVFRGWTQMLADQSQLPQVRCIRLGSEQTGIEDVELFQKHFTEACVMQIGFASSETHQIVRYFIGHDSRFTDKIPLGYPAEGTRIMILDDDRKPVGVTRVGEIAVQGPSVSVGYWQKPDLTSSVFLPDLNGGDQRTYLTGDLGRIAGDGCLEFLGRKDFQVKIRGYHVNIAEVEQYMRGVDLVKDVLVVAKPSSSSGHQLIAYVIPTAPAALTISDLRLSLSRIFPEYKIPSYYVFLDSLPLLPGGKVDRRALPEIGNGRPELGVPYLAPRMPSEESLVHIWEEALGLDQVGIHDNFLELGGDSLKASHVITRVIKTFQIDVSLKSLFESPTVSDMAVIIVQSQLQRVNQDQVDRMLTELESSSGEAA